MYQNMREDCDKIVRAAIAKVKPDEAVKRALAGKEFAGKGILVAVGKAGWQMAKAAVDVLGDRVL